MDTGHLFLRFIPCFHVISSATVAVVRAMQVPFPFVCDGAPTPALWQHVGLYAYRRPFLLDFVHLTPTPLEKAEGLEQLRALENGHPIRCATIQGWRSVPVDVPSDVKLVEAHLARGSR